MMNTVPCKVCRTPLPAKDDGFVLKYFRVIGKRGDSVV